MTGDGGSGVDDVGDADEVPGRAAAGRPDWVPDSVDLSRPRVARVYDYALGGSHSFAVDREFFREVEAVLPGMRQAARANRAFLHRAVRFMIEEGVRQFLDIGSGIPTVGNVHEIAQRLAPEARVVYVDIDPVAVAHSRLILANNPRAAAIREDLRRPQAIFDHPDTQALLDFDQAVGLILAAILHAIPDQDDPHSLMTRFRDKLCLGSYVAISHGTADSRPEEIRAATQIYERTSTPGTLRTRAEILQFFTGLELVEPGLVDTAVASGPPGGRRRPPGTHDCLRWRGT